MFDSKTVFLSSSNEPLTRATHTTNNEAFSYRATYIKTKTPLQNEQNTEIKVGDTEI